MIFHHWFGVQTLLLRKKKDLGSMVRLSKESLARFRGYQKFWTPTKSKEIFLAQVNQKVLRYIVNGLRGDSLKLKNISLAEFHEKGMGTQFVNHVKQYAQSKGRNLIAPVSLGKGDTPSESLGWWQALGSEKVGSNYSVTRSK
jgi:predicted acetyltransferase